MDKDKIIESLIDAAEINGCIEILNLFGKNIRVKLTFDDNTLSTKVIHINSFSTRSRNALLRSNLNDVKSIVNYLNTLEDSKNIDISALGSKSYNQIKTILIVLSYNKMNETEKKSFWEYIIDNNIFRNS